MEYIADERRQASLDGYFQKFTAEQLGGIQALAMEMWEAFAASVRTHLTDADADAEIVYEIHYRHIQNAEMAWRRPLRTRRSPVRRPRTSCPL